MVSLILLATLLVTGATPGGPTLVVELASTKSTDAFQLTFRARGSSDVYFKSDAVRLEIRSTGGNLLRYECGDKRDLPADPVRLRPGQTVSKTIDATCYHPAAGVRYEVTAVFEDRGDDLRGEPPAGAMCITGPIRSNRIAVRFEAPHNKVSQADDHLGRFAPSVARR